MPTCEDPAPICEEHWHRDSLLLAPPKLHQCHSSVKAPLPVVQELQDDRFSAACRLGQPSGLTSRVSQTAE